jgi:hypothetical protein
VNWVWPLATTVLVAGLGAARRLRRPPQAERGRPIYAYTLQLTRIQDRRRLIHQTHEIGLGERDRALALAYDYVLIDCATALQIEAPPTPLREPLPPTEEFRLELELAGRGLRW